jgi:hypothetical protein
MVMGLGVSNGPVKLKEESEAVAWPHHSAGASRNASEPGLRLERVIGALIVSLGKKIDSIDASRYARLKLMIALCVIYRMGLKVTVLVISVVGAFLVV